MPPPRLTGPTDAPRSRLPAAGCCSPPAAAAVGPPRAAVAEKGTFPFRPHHRPEGPPERYRLAERAFSWEMDTKLRLPAIGVPSTASASLAGQD